MSTCPSNETLHGMSLTAAMRLAVAYSGKGDEEIAAAMGWSASVTSRVFSNNDYWPSLPTLPRFCAVVGNDIIARWVVANMTTILSTAPPMDAVSLLSAMGQLFGEMAHVAAEGQEALKDGHVSQREARRIIHQLRDVFAVGTGMVSRLQATIDQSK